MNNYDVYLPPDRLITVKADKFVDDKKSATFLRGEDIVAKFYLGMPGSITGIVREEEDES